VTDVDIAEFITARLDEDESAARGVHIIDTAPWHLLEWYDGVFNDGVTARVDLRSRTGAVTDRGALPRPVGVHIARHDPAHVLAEIKAKRKLLALHELQAEPERWGDLRTAPTVDLQWKPTGKSMYWCETCDHDRSYGHISHQEEGCETMRLLAAPYADHPDYQQEWGTQ
jgi:Family of unknown function (DUF6221)